MNISYIDHFTSTGSETLPALVFMYLLLFNKSFLYNHLSFQNVSNFIISNFINHFKMICLTFWLSYIWRVKILAILCAFELVFKLQKILRNLLKTTDERWHLVRFYGCVYSTVYRHYLICIALLVNPVLKAWSQRTWIVRFTFTKFSLRNSQSKQGT